MSQTTQDAIDLLIETKDKIPNYKVYYTMKGMNLKFIHPATVEYVKACLALHTFNLTITTNLVSKIMDKGYSATMLHSLGDKHILVLKRSDKKSINLEWIIDPTFLKYYEGELEK